MKFTCDRCGKRYSSTDDPVPGRLYRIQCKCGHVILVRGGADGHSAETTPSPRRSGTPTPPRAPPAAPQPASAPPPAPAAPAAWPGPGAEPPQFDGDPFAAAPVRSAHPAATPAGSLDPLAGAWGAQPSAPAAPDPVVRQPDPVAREPGPVVRQPFPEPQPFSPGLEGDPLAGSARSSDLELETLVGGPSAVPDPAADPFQPADVPGQPSLTMPVPPPPLARPGAQAAPRADAVASQPLPMAPFARRRETSSGRGKLIAIAGGIAAVALALGAWFFVVRERPTSTTSAVAPPSPASNRQGPPLQHSETPTQAPARDSAPAPPSAPTSTSTSPPPPAPATAAHPERAAPETPRTQASTARREERPARREQQVLERAPDATPNAPPAAPTAPPSAPAPQASAPAPQASAPTPTPAAKPAKQGLETSEVLAVIRQNRAGFDACIAEAVAGGAPATWLGRRVDLLVTVNPSGRVTDPLVDDPEVEPSALGACLRRTAAKMIFPSFQGDAVPVAIPLRLGKVE